MAISFTKDSVYVLQPISLEQVNNEVNGLLIDDEEGIMAFKASRNQLLFTNKRIITLESQGLTGKRKIFYTFPYSKVHFFSVQTPGFAEIWPETELLLIFDNGATVHLKFDEKTDIGLIGRMISEYVL